MEDFLSCKIQHHCTLWLIESTSKNLNKTFLHSWFHRKSTGKKYPLLHLCFCGLRRNEANQEPNQWYHREIRARRQASHHTTGDYSIPIPMNFLYPSKHLPWSFVLQLYSCKIPMFFLFLCFCNPTFQYYEIYSIINQIWNLSLTWPSLMSQSSKPSKRIWNPASWVASSSLGWIYVGKKLLASSRMTFDSYSSLARSE